MHTAVAERFDECDALIMAAAPADFAPVAAAARKIKKAAAELTLELSPTVDILQAMGKRKRQGQVLIGFALETNDGLTNARMKLTSKNLDLIVLNSLEDAGAGFDHDTNTVTILRSQGKSLQLPLMDKAEVGRRLIAELARLLV
jgi:phosphopantothenoylcysteine decarboxylase/phosphopantothenate--cysteine ligase